MVIRARGTGLDERRTFFFLLVRVISDEQNS